MPNKRAATSILELLTHPNPAVSHETTRNKTNTRGNYWYWPKQLKRWEEFDNFKILEASFAGHLLQEAHREGRELPSYPTIYPDIDCVIRDEGDTKDLIDKWNKAIVMAALEPIRHDFHPAIWHRGDPPPTQEDFELQQPVEKIRTQPPRKSSNQARNPKKQSARRLEPDSGSIPWDSPLSGPDSASISFRQERFPKEYKPANKWRSDLMVELELINEFGEWERGKINHNYAMPVRQAYSYCIQHMCRYGCILTCQEAFIFRVRPRDTEPVNGLQDSKLLRKRLIHDGLMEYISIPWANRLEGDVRSHQTWTVNLALWYLHILAGNNYEADWRYNHLKDEKLTVPPTISQRQSGPIPVVAGESKDRGKDEERETEESESSDSEDSESTVLLEISPTLKRKRELDMEEGYHLSFTKRQFT
ncbi:hypothetical protein B7463_g7381, partial [Scytalidium lignicola]